MNIILIGFKNSGKTTLGLTLAEKLDYAFIDTDEVLVLRHSRVGGNPVKTIREIYQTEGETQFRTLETKAIFSISPCENTVIATGGGSVLNQDNILYLKSLSEHALVLHVFISWEEAYKRQQGEISSLPFMTQEEYERRIKIYEALADEVV